MTWTIGSLVEASGGRLTTGNPERAAGRISTDTRNMAQEDCFVALSGENHDGHSFVMEAISRGASVIVVESGRLPDAFHSNSHATAVIEVPDTLYALGELARRWRSRFGIQVVGVTGSNGKTGTKELVAGMLGQRRWVLKNRGNFNNLIGVPLTLLELEPGHEAAVVELGINVPGEMARLVEISSPTVGIITNVHPAHLEGLQSLDRIVEEKGKLWLSLARDDLAVVNLDDERLRNFARNLHARSVTYSMENPSADVAPAGPPISRADGVSFPLRLGKEIVEVHAPLFGIHQVQNAVAAAAAVWAMGEPAEVIVSGLAAHVPVRQRMQVHRLDDGRTVVDDAYNANPGSMKAALKAVGTASGGGPFIAVLGDMRELGPDSAALHREVGRRLKASGVTRLITIGDASRHIAEGAVESGFDREACRHAVNHEEAAGWLTKEQVGNAWILVKGSRAMAMEKVVERILKE